MVVGQFADHYRQRELRPDNGWRSYATSYAYEDYFRKWIVPRWGEYPLGSIRTIPSMGRSLAFSAVSAGLLQPLFSRFSKS